MPTIRIDDDVYAWLQSQARPFEDTPNSVLRRVSRLDAGPKLGGPGAKNRSVRSVSNIHGEQTRQKDFRQPLLMVLKRHNGMLHRSQALKDLEADMVDKLTNYDKADINSGTIRWQKSAEWEVHVMREEGLLEPVLDAPRGTWVLTDKGWNAASAL